MHFLLSVCRVASRSNPADQPFRLDFLRSVYVMQKGLNLSCQRTCRSGESTGALTLEKHDSLSRSSNMDRQHWTYPAPLIWSWNQGQHLETSPTVQIWKIKKDALDRSCFTFRLHSCPNFLETDRNLFIIFSLGMFNEARRRRMRNHVARFSFVNLYTFV